MISAAPTRLHAIAEALERGNTLPATWYTDPAIFQQEQERIFRKSWQYAGHVSRLPEPGDYLTLDIADIPIVVLRDQDGELRAHVNVCRHRGHQVVTGCGNKKALQCPYHAWTYRLDGSLVAAPRSDREPNFDKAEYSLFPVQLDTWGPLIFVNPDPQAGPLSEALGDLPRQVAEAGVDFAALTLHERYGYEIKSNWKVFVENSIECYHCPVAHPGFSDYIDIDPDVYRLSAYPTFISHIGWLRTSTVDADPPDFYFYYQFPSLMLAASPEKLLVSSFVPISPDRTVEVSEIYYTARKSAEDIAAASELSRKTIEEDLGLVESVQRGLRSGVLSHGRFLLNSEHLLQHFDKMVYAALAE
jgi:choline monooxygenase